MADIHSTYIRKKKPLRAADVVKWAKSMVGKRLDIDRRYGAQCWDLPNEIIWKRYGIFVPGNANALAWYNYPKGWKKYKNTPSFVPKPGDIAVWSIPAATGHTAIVVGPSNTKTFRSVDQNWFNANSYYGSKAAYVTHNYTGISAFIRPPYSAPKKTGDKAKDKEAEEKHKAESNGNDTDAKNTGEKAKPKYINKTQKVVKYTAFDEELSIPHQTITQYIDGTTKRGYSPKGVMIRESNDFRSAAEVYKNRNRFTPISEYPHVYIDRNFEWQCTHTMDVSGFSKDDIVIEVCGSNTDSNDDYELNVVFAMIAAFNMLNWSNIKLSKDVIKVSNNIWRIVKKVTGHDIIKDGFITDEDVEKVKTKLMDYYTNNEEYRTDTIKKITTKTTIKVKNPKASESTTVNNTNKDTGSKSSSSSSKSSTSSSSKPKISVVKSGYTFTQALNKQMTVNPQISNGYSWYSASRSQTSSAMNPTTIWKSSTQKYQMLNLGKYQGISVSKLNKLLKGKGTLSGQGKAFAAACKKHNVNEIYLIAHALLESGNGSSNFASGRYGIYNYFGIGAYDSNPNYAITYARNRGWTTPAKGIMGGAKFVRKDFISVGQNTLYRMRWNPKHPATHQYATDVRWAQHQAVTIKNYYSKIDAKGLYYIRDKYK